MTSRRSGVGRLRLWTTISAFSNESLRALRLRSRSFANYSQAGDRAKCSDNARALSDSCLRPPQQGLKQQNPTWLRTSMPKDVCIICYSHKMKCGVCFATTKIVGAKLFRRRHGQTKMTVSVRLHCWVLLSYDRTWKNMVHTSSNLCQTNVEQGSWDGGQKTGVRSHLVIRDVIMVWDTSKWFRILIKQNKKSWNGVLKSVPKNMWRWSSETWMFAHILKYQHESWTFLRFFPKK